MPRNSDFPEYTGIRTEHVNFDPIEYHNRKLKKEDTSLTQGLGEIKCKVSPRNTQPTTNDQEILDKTAKAAREDWRSRGLSNNKIEDF